MKVHELWNALEKPASFSLSDYGFVEIDIFYCLAEGDGVRNITFCLRPEQVDELPECWLTHCKEIGDKNPDCITAICFSAPECRNRIFYTVVEEGDKKVVHLFGNVYYNDAHDGDDCYRIAEWSSLVLTPEQIKGMVDAFPDALYDGFHYMGNLTRESAIATCQSYFDGEPGVYMSVFDVNEETLCGNYYMGGA